jgi:hypothetical protein
VSTRKPDRQTDRTNDELPEQPAQTGAESGEPSTSTDDPNERDDRKGRVIHARVPEDLDRELKRKASRLGVSVSNLVRNVLQNTFGLVEDIVADSATIARSARGEPPVPLVPTTTSGSNMLAAPTAAAAVLAAPATPVGYQELTLTINAVCDRCNALLPKGTPAALAVYDRPGPRRFLCRPCFDKETATP